MGLWKKIKKAVKKAAEAVENAVNDVGDAIGNAIESIGDGINDVVTWVGEKTGIGFVKSVAQWLGGIVKGVFAVVGAIVKGLFGIIGGVLGGIIEIVGGVLTLQGNLILDGVWGIVSSIIGTVIVVVGKVIALIQSIFYIQGFERPLTDEEKKQLKRVFKDSLNYYVIRIVEKHSGLFGISSRPFTLGNTIYLKNNDITWTLLVHETTHVWQFQQRGVRYTSDAIAAQWFVEDAYSWQREIDVRDKDDWSDFNKEAQAEFIEDVWDKGELGDSSGNTLTDGSGNPLIGEGHFFDADRKKSFGYFEVDGKDYTAIARDAVDTIR